MNDTSTTLPSEAHEDFKLLGKYLLTKKLGTGATSSVFFGVDVKTLKIVAIKKVTPESLQGVYKKMFAVEASLCGKLHHPNIVEILEAHSEKIEETYLVMEYVDGYSLETRSTPDTLLPVEMVIDIIRQTAEALNFAFKNGVLHRDVKPANIMVRQDGLVKITDFGCAWLSDVDTTQIGVAGSLSYMSPEQLEGKPLNHQSDIYSLGAVFYRLLTGKSMYNSTQAVDLMRQIVSAPPIPLDTVRMDIPPEIERVVYRALQKDLKSRYQDWSEFLSDLYACNQLEFKGTVVKDAYRFNLISKCNFFKDFLTVELWEVLRASKWRTFTHNEVLIREGEHGFSFFVVLEGSLSVSKQRRLLNLIQPGECVGESSCLYAGSPIRGATVSAQGKVTVIEISKGSLETFSREVGVRMDRALLLALNKKLMECNDRLLSALGL